MGKIVADKSVDFGSGSGWVSKFPRLKGLRATAAAELMVASRLVVLSTGSTVFQQGDPCLNYILVLRGSVRVGLIDLEGNEVTLYRLKAKDSCILTTASLLASKAYSAFAITESEVEAVLVPKASFMRTLDGSDAFREVVFTDHGERFLDLMRVVGHLAFKSIDYRLAEKLEELANAERVLCVTHESLAVELGTAREVVSRRLKRFEQDGWIRLQKGKISLLPNFFVARRRFAGTTGSSE